MTEGNFDLIVIGCGVSGFTAAIMAAGLGKKVLVIEKETSPLDAALRSGLPSKILMRSAIAADMINDAEKYGLGRPAASVDSSRVLQKVRFVIRGMDIFDKSGALRRLGIHIKYGGAEFIDRHHISIDGSVYSAPKFIIATGAKNAEFKLLKTSGVDYLTTDALFRLEKLPASIVIIGGGPSGIELALALRMLGVEVTVIESGATILGSEDAEVVRKVSAYLNGRGLKILTSHKATAIHKSGNRVVLKATGPDSETTVTAESVMVTIGQEANIEGLALEKAGVEYDRHAIKVDKKLRTTANNIYASGDVTGGVHLVGVAEHEGLVAANNALLPFKQTATFKDLVWTVFTKPPLAHVGMTEEQAKSEYGLAYKVYRMDYGKLLRAQLDQETHGYAKIICDQKGKLLGAHIFGANADDIAHELQLMKSLGKPIWRLHHISYAFPTYSTSLIKRIGDVAYVEHLAANPFIRLFLKLLPGYRNRIEAVKEELQG